MFRLILNKFYTIKKGLNQKGSGMLNNISLKVNLEEDLPDDFDFVKLKKDISSEFYCSEFDVKVTYESKILTINFISEIIDNSVISEKISELFKNLNVNVKDIGSITTNESTDNSLTSLIKKAEQIKNAPKLQIDLAKTKLKIDQLKKITDILKETNVDGLKNLPRIENAFNDYTLQLDKVSKNYEISKKNIPIIIKPPLEDNSVEYHSLYEEMIDSLDNLNPDIDDPENLEEVINVLSKKMNNLKEKKNTLEDECEEVKKKYKELLGKSVYEDYFEEQKKIYETEGKVLYREIGTDTFDFGESNQDIVFYNGTKKELENDTSKPIQSYKNSFIEEDHDQKGRLLEELIESIKLEDNYPTLKSFYEDNVLKQSAAGFESFKVNYTGGFEIGKNMKDITDNLASIRSYLLEFQKKNAECQKIKFDFNLLFIQNTFYHLYMINSIKKVILTDTQLLYSLLTVGNCQYYLNIINTILTRIEKKKMGINERYFQKYHFLLLKNLKSLFNFIILLSKKNNFKDLTSGKNEDLASNTSQSVIDINNCRGVTRDLLASFNSFKDILDAYKNETLPSVSVFVRINDWEKDNSPDGYNNKKIAEREGSEIIFSKNEDDGRILDIGFKNCGSIDNRLGLDKGSAKNDFFSGDSLVKKYNPIKQIKVADVLPSIDIPTNESLNKYMGISSKLSQGKDTMMITSGYSGTGKTFSLFGGGGHPGLLQSTLSEIQGVETIYFRVFEIYALGIQYPFYWENKENIYQRLYTYDLKINKSKLDVERVHELNNFTDIREYIGKVSKVKSGSDTSYTSYTEINYEQYKNFSNFIDIIDNYRQKTETPSNQDSSYPQRIKKTSNNPASSRSILVYEFIMKTKSGNTLLIMVDLPGLEDVEATYILDNKFSVSGDKGNLIGAALLANPLFAPLYKAQYTKAIESFINEIKITESEIITGWLKEESLNLTYGPKSGYKAVAEPISKYFKETGEINFDEDKKSPARTAWRGTDLYTGPGQMQGDIQRKNNGYFYFILHLIKEGRIDLIIKLMTKLVETEKDSNIKDLYEENKEGTTDYESLEEKIMQSYEGIAINENILGLIYLIVSQVTEERNGKVLYKNASHQIKSQIDIADLEHSDKFRMKQGEYPAPNGKEKKYIETYNGTNYFKENAGEILVRQSRGVNKKTVWNEQNVDLDKLDDIELYSKSVKDYDHTKIFTVKQKESEQDPFITKDEIEKRKKENNFPLIWYYLEPYFNSIKNIQLLLLLTNNDPQKKCFAQINYLLDSISFIEALDPDL